MQNRYPIILFTQLETECVLLAEASTLGWEPDKTAPEEIAVYEDGIGSHLFWFYKAQFKNLELVAWIYYSRNTDAVWPKLVVLND